MAKHPRHDDDQPNAAKFRGLSSDKPIKSISVERPLDSDKKTVIETNLDDSNGGNRVLPAGSTVSTARTKSSATKPTSGPQHLKPTVDHDTVLELPPSPEHRKAHRRKLWTIIAIIVLVLVTGGWALLYFSPILAVEEISHEGLDLVAESEAVERTAVLLDTPLPQVNDRNATELFADNPAVDDVTVRAELPHGLVVRVNEHTPVAMSPKGKQYVVFSESGIELTEIPSQRAQEFDLPVVALASDVVDQEVFATITEVLGSLPDELRDEVRAASGASIDSIELELSSGKTVMWGNNEQAQKKSQVLAALLELDGDQAAEISEYDVSAPDFPVTR